MTVSPDTGPQVRHPTWCTATHNDDAPGSSEHLGPIEQLALTADQWLVNIQLSRWDDHPTNGAPRAGDVGITAAFTSLQLADHTAQPFLTPDEAQAVGEAFIAGAEAARRAS